jgi:hypothetical protein
MRPVLLIDNDNERPFWRYENEIGVRHFVALAACHSDLVGHKRHRTIKFADRLDDHESSLFSLRFRIKQQRQGVRNVASDALALQLISSVGCRGGRVARRIMFCPHKSNHAADTAAATGLIELYWLGGFSDDFVKTRIVSQLVPQRVQLQLAGVQARACGDK